MNKKILIIFGGMSSEHSISCISAASIIKNIDKIKYDVSMIGIDELGVFYKYTGDIINLKTNKWNYDFEFKEEITDIIKELKNYDVAFPVLHGKYGEDGTIQGIFEFAKVKYVGCKVLGSAIAIDKILSKKLVEAQNIPIVEYIEISKNEYNDILKNNDKISNYFFKNVENKIGYPLIIKPNREGSSYGVVKVKSIEEIKDAIEYSFKYDDKILIEKYISNRQEIECSVIENKEFEERIYLSTPGEIISANDLYDFNSKYENNKSFVKIPADISEENIVKIKEYSKKIFKILNLSSLSRVDFFVSNDKVYFNEVNTLPGFTDISMYPKLLIYDGIEYKKIIEILIENA